MKNIIPFLIVVLSAQFFLTCESDDIERPSDSEEPTNLILNPSFESNGKPSLDGWVTVFDDSFRQDTPSEGGSWSILLQPGWIPAEGSATAYFQGAAGENVYELSVWLKSLNGWSGSLSFGLKSSGDRYPNKLVTLNPSEWTKLVMRDTLILQQPESLFVKLSAGMAEFAIGIVLFDLVHVAKVE